MGLAFNTKTLAAYLIVPGLGLGYLVCAPGVAPRRLLAAARGGRGADPRIALVVALVELTPASQRPFVGGSTDNTELNLTFGYNGLGRVEGQVGGPGRIPVLVKYGSLAHIEREALRARALRAGAPGGEPGPGGSSARTRARRRPAPAAAPASRPKRRSARGRAPPQVPAERPRARADLLRRAAPGRCACSKPSLGGQAGWMLPFALLGLIALALWSVDFRASPVAEDAAARSR